MRHLIVEKRMDKRRSSTAEAEGISNFKNKIEIGKTIEFSWWSMYGSGSNVKRIIKDVTHDGKPLVRFQGWGSWQIEFHEINDIYQTAFKR